jgi:prepilin-type N-terminal cleavage/methylation domain-containing protein
MKQRGFTLIELLVVMVILSILLVIVGQFIASQTTILRKQQVIANTQQNVRVAGDILTRDIEMACLNPRRITGSTFTFQHFDNNLKTAGNYIGFTMDLDGDGMYDTPPIDSLPRLDEYRGFQLRGDTLVRLREPPGGRTEDIAVGIDSLTFVYWTKDSTVVPGSALRDSLWRVARVDFRIVGRSTRPYRGSTYIYRRVASRVVVRNRAA